MGPGSPALSTFNKSKWSRDKRSHKKSSGRPRPPPTPTHSPLPAHPQMPEEEAFCVFVRLMQEYRLRELFKPSMAELGLCIYQFEYMLQVSGPRGGPACPPTSSSPHIRVLTSAVPVSLFD